MPACGKFAAATAALPPQLRAAAFVRDFAPRYPDYYAPEVFGDASRMQARALCYFDPALAAVVFPDVPPLTAEHLATLGGVVGTQFAQQQRRFMQTFTDFSCDTIVEFGVSLLKFDGHPVEFGGKKYLLFGVDIIAMLHSPADMPTFFDHEIFHLYHRQVIGLRAPLLPLGEIPFFSRTRVSTSATARAEELRRPSRSERSDLLLQVF
jgi:hypothetical protein